MKLASQRLREYDRFGVQLSKKEHALKQQLTKSVRVHRKLLHQAPFASNTKTPKSKSDDCIRFHRGGVLESEEDIKKDVDSHQAPSDADAKRKNVLIC